MTSPREPATVTPREPMTVTEPAVARLEQEVARLRQDLRDQRRIGPAVGMLAGRLGVDPEQARARLGELARAYGVSLADAAAAVLAARRPGTADPPHTTRVSAVLDTARILASSAGRQPDRSGGQDPGMRLAAGSADGAVVDPAGGTVVDAADGAAGTASAVAADHAAAPTGMVAAAPTRRVPEDFDALAAALCDQLTEHLGLTAVGLLALEPDGSLRLAGSAGIPAATAAAWRRIPEQLRTSVVETARTGRPRWLPRLAEAQQKYALVGAPEMSWPSRAALPMREGDRVVGVAAVYCLTPHPFDPATRRAVTRLVGGYAPRFAELVRLHPDQAAWVADTQAILDMLPGAVALQLPIRDDDGRIVDYLRAAASPGAVDMAGRRGRELVGLRTLEAYPSLADSDLVRAYERVMETGQAREIGPFTYTEQQGDAVVEAMYSVTAHRYREGLLTSWVRHDEDQRYAVRLSHTERLANLGWVEWDLTTNTLYWSNQVYEIFERDQAAGPASLEEIAARVLPEDVPMLEAAVTALLEDRRPMDLTYRIQVASGLRFIRSLFQAVHDEKGRPVRIYGIAQDVTAVEAADQNRRRLADIEQQLAERQRTLQTEHRVVAALQQIILPLPVRPIELPGLQVAVRYQPAEELARVGGDWYDLISLPGGRTLLAVGDVAGHGITAAATMARLRHALTALALITNDPAELLEYLNRMVCDDPAEPTATVVVARYDPHTGTLTWAQAGHPPPVLITGGAATPVDRPTGMLVGARRDARYGSADLRLPDDSRLLLFTDGLIERRGRFDSDWLAPLLATVAGGDREPVDALLNRLQPANPDDDTCVLVLRPLPT
jgi:serine phosphatase RsbU (regulator of sigma subunit)